MEVLTTSVFEDWLKSLLDRRAKAIIVSRIDKVSRGLLGDVKALGDGLSELRIDYGPGYRLYCKQMGNLMIFLLCGGDKRTQQRDIENAKKLMKLHSFDAADYLETDEEISVFLNEALKANDPAYFAHAVGVVAKAKGMTAIAQKTGLAREQLYRSFSEEGNPTIKSVFSVLNALGIELTASVRAQS